MSNRGGTLFVVATPIGNLADLSPRAVETLGAVRLIVAEDTRHSRRLLDLHGIRVPLASLHEHNERGVVAALAERLERGEDLALISDAGTPLVSDPGFRLVREARARGVRVSPVPGACAAIAALSVAGLPSDRFRFEGFLPARAAARRARLRELAGESATLIFYEAGRRLVDCLHDLVEAFGAARPAVLARELTKRHETVLGDSLQTLLETLQRDPDQRLGEAVLVVGGAAPAGAGDAEGLRVLRLLLDEGLAPSRAAALAARLSGASRRRLYRAALDADGE